MTLSLVKALRAQSSLCIAFIGAGGKSTAMFNLARELSSPVIVTATSHLGIWQIDLADKHIIIDDHAGIERFENELNGVTLVTGKIEGDRTLPINDGFLAQLNSFCQSHSIPMLIEADGSRQKPLKAWAGHEPPIPKFTDLVVQIVGMSGLGKSLTNERVHRAELFSKLSGVKMGEPVTVESLTRSLTHIEGGLKNIPPSARKVILLNQVDKLETQSVAHKMADGLLHHYQSVIVASLKDETIHAVHEPIAGIILAAGKASRYGKPKQLLKWKGNSFVHVVAETALRAGLSPVIIVTGAHAEQVESVVHDLDVLIVQNDEWESGQGSSIGSGVRHIPNTCGGAIFLLVDQPQVNTSILHALKEKHADGLYPIVAPMVIDRRANPVLFDRTTFPDLMTIEGDTGGRAIFHKHRVEYLPWHDDSLLLDVDTPEQYQRLIGNEDL